MCTLRNYSPGQSQWCKCIRGKRGRRRGHVSYYHISRSQPPFRKKRSYFIASYNTPTPKSPLLYHLPFPSLRLRARKIICPFLPSLSQPWHLKSLVIPVDSCLPHARRIRLRRIGEVGWQKYLFRARSARTYLSVNWHPLPTPSTILSLCIL